ncbi:MAG TPA: zinc-dependent metalloprotease [Thermoleophilaceae bacterium]|nr:zinc-dependent metalloprotease [Thermoleophilaceae bacterium]
MVDWSLARQIARFAAGGGSAEPAPRSSELGALVGDAEGHLREYTGLPLAEPIPKPEPVTRGEWADVNLDSLAALLEPVSTRLAERLGSAGPFAGPLRAVTSATLAAEAGLVIGYMSQRVLGQYEVSLLDVERPPRLLFVTANLEKAVRELRSDRDSFMGWIVLHELTHVFEFSGVPWLRGHMSTLMREYMRTVEVRFERGAAGGLPSLPDPSKIVQEFREGGLVALVQSREQRRLMGRIQSAMAVVEGYSEHVMDAVGERVLPEYAGLRDAMERRRRSRSYPERVLQRLLGLDLKMRQYEEGKAFCDGVVERAGIAGLNRVWESPEQLPSAAELGDPEAWLGRVGTAPAAAAS